MNEFSAENSPTLPHLALRFGNLVRFRKGFLCACKKKTYPSTVVLATGSKLYICLIKIVENPWKRSPLLFCECRFSVSIEMNGCATENCICLIAFLSTRYMESFLEYFDFFITLQNFHRKYNILNYINTIL